LHGTGIGHTIDGRDYSDERARRRKKRRRRMVTTTQR
jgi:hypothetical protein